MCMITRWIFGCCEQEYWTWKPRSCEVVGKRCQNRPDRWYISKTIKKVNIGTCWRCEDGIPYQETSQGDCPEAHPELIGSHKEKERVVESDDNDGDKRSSSNWHDIEVEEVNDGLPIHIDPSSKYIRQSNEKEHTQGSDRYELRSRPYHPGSAITRQEPEYESAEEVTEAISSVQSIYNDRARKRRKHNHQDLMPAYQSSPFSSVESVSKERHHQANGLFEVTKELSGNEQHQDMDWKSDSVDSPSAYLPQGQCFIAPVHMPNAQQANHSPLPHFSSFFETMTHHDDFFPTLLDDPEDEERVPKVLVATLETIFAPGLQSDMKDEVENLHS